MMETTAVSSPEHAHQLEVLQVRYPPAPKPFIEHHPDPSETIGSLRERAKTFFGVADTTLPNGDRILFYLIFGRDRLENDAATVGSVVGDDPAPHFRLGKQHIQG
jgi:hypothetical protein